MLINKQLMKHFVHYGIIIMFCLNSGRVYAQVNDTIYFHIFGEFNKGEKYALRSNNKVLFEFGCDKKISEYKLYVGDQLIKYFDDLHVSICKWTKDFSGCYWGYIQYPIIYYPGLNHIIIYYIPSSYIEFQVFYFPNFKHALEIDNLEDLLLNDCRKIKRKKKR